MISLRDYCETGKVVIYSSKAGMLRGDYFLGTHPTLGLGKAHPWLDLTADAVDASEGWEWDGQGLPPAATDPGILSAMRDPSLWDSLANDHES